MQALEFSVVFWGRFLACWAWNPKPYARQFWGLGFRVWGVVGFRVWGFEMQWKLTGHPPPNVALGALIYVSIQLCA